LPDRNYRGGPITLSAQLTAIRKDTVLGGMLKSAASASLNIVAELVETARIAGPAQVLSVAGSEVIRGVQTVLGESAQDREPLFDFGGLSVSIQPSDITGPATFLLLHRGALLDEAGLEVRTTGQLLMPFHKGAVLEDG